MLSIIQTDFTHFAERAASVRILVTALFDDPCSDACYYEFLPPDILLPLQAVGSAEF